MKKQTPTAIANNPNSTPEQLASVYESSRQRPRLFRRIDRLLASHLNTPIEILADLAKEDDWVTSSNALNNPGLPKVVADHSSLRLDKDNVLIGDYPIRLDVRFCDYGLPECRVHSNDDYERANKEGGYPTPDIHICGSNSVEEICLPARIGYEYVIIENLPNLSKLRVGSACKDRFRHETPQWLICKSLPKLREISVGAGVSWLLLEDMESLTVVDVGRSVKLDYFSIKNCPAIKTINIENCGKLKGIEGLAETMQESLGVTSHIKALQESSRRDGLIYNNMTFTDVEIVLSNINHALVLAARNGLFPNTQDEVEENSEVMNNIDSYGYYFRLLRPNEAVYTGNTGESYVYETFCPSYTDGRRDSDSDFGIGNSSQETCLEYILHDISMRGIDIPGRRSHSKRRFNDYPTNEEILTYLNQLLDEEYRQSSLGKRS